MLLVKLDISKTIDWVRWDYLLSLLDHLGFPSRCRNRVASSCPHPKCCSMGSPASQSYIEGAFDPWHRLLHLTTEAVFLTRITRNRLWVLTSMYVDNAIIFIKPPHDYDQYSKILYCTYLMQSYNNVNLDEVLAGFQAARACFTINYLGTSSRVTWLRKVDFQYLRQRKCQAGKLEGP